MAPISRQAIASARALVCLAVLGTGPAVAQVGPGDAGQPNTTIPEKEAKSFSSAADLTKKKEGVIVPKHDIDPDMSKVPPGPTSDKNVIPPKGTTGTSGVDPK